MTPPNRQPAIARLVDPGASFEGLISFRGHARIDGDFTGSVMAWGALEIGESAVVRASIEVDDLVVAGSLEGDATARRRLTLAPTARVRGVLRAPSLALAEGCVVDGRCEAGSARREPKAARDRGSEPDSKPAARGRTRAP
ncbi:MAG: polymer-forming cytoskeletal protein [Deltaproteobacteria bacterium]|nr:MAG: polymer-forming cytoskeletal protein [Deltaproteobacteria bacterium]